MSKLYELKQDTAFKLEDKEYLMHNIDGIYSYCTDEDKNVYHFAAWTEVKEIETMD
jgi:hypothetical protein